MKIRVDFVTNSSSAMYVICLHDTLSVERLATLLADHIDAESIQYCDHEQLTDALGHEYFEEDGLTQEDRYQLARFMAQALRSEADSRHITELEGFKIFQAYAYNETEDLFTMLLYNMGWPGRKDLGIIISGEGC